jgi:SagB-type dehydrogenase family enzyme
MIPSIWEKTLVKQEEDEPVWELFHENSKLHKYQKALSDENILKRMKALHESLPFEGYPIIDLPNPVTPLSGSLDELIASRSSALTLSPISISLNQLATLLHYGYGVTRDNSDNTKPRAFRAVPSAGALFPLELFFHSQYIEEVPSGLYHFNPSQNHIRRLREGEETEKLSQGFIQPSLAQGASIHIFLTGMFERTTYKYGDRGYRFVFLEAGHVAQNFNLVATSLGLGCLNVGGFFDRAIDDFLGLDGLTHSTLYVTLLGKRA